MIRIRPFKINVIVFCIQSSQLRVYDARYDDVGKEMKYDAQVNEWLLQAIIFHGPIPEEHYTIFYYCYYYYYFFITTADR